MLWIRIGVHADPDTAIYDKADRDSDPDPWFGWSKLAIYLSLGLHEGCPFQAIGKPSSPQKRTSSTINIFLHFFLFLWGHFCPPRSGYRSSRPIRIYEDPEPHPQHHALGTFRSMFILWTVLLNEMYTKYPGYPHTNTPAMTSPTYSSWHWHRFNTTDLWFFHGNNIIVFFS